jgi:hypothetical protein
MALCAVIGRRSSIQNLTPARARRVQLGEYVRETWLLA